MPVPGGGNLPAKKLGPLFAQRKPPGHREDKGPMRKRKTEGVPDNRRAFDAERIQPGGFLGNVGGAENHVVATRLGRMHGRQQKNGE